MISPVAKCSANTVVSKALCNRLSILKYVFGHPYMDVEVYDWLVWCTVGKVCSMHYCWPFM
jgi:hypothetical protein